MKAWTIERLSGYLQALVDAGKGDCEVEILPDIIDPGDDGYGAGRLVVARFKPAEDASVPCELQLRYSDVDGD